ncbi:MAG: phosphotransferase [Bdellovibrionota bacterium]
MDPAVTSDISIIPIERRDRILAKLEYIFPELRKTTVVSFYKLRGFTNSSYLVEVNNDGLYDKRVYRVAAIHPTSFSGCRNQEREVLELISDEKWSPSVLSYDSSTGNAAFKFTEGIPLNKLKVTQDILVSVARVLRQIHNIDLKETSIKQYEIIERVDKLQSQVVQLGLEIPDKIKFARDRIIDAFNRASEIGNSSVLSHNDCLPENVLLKVDGSVELIDWELAGKGLGIFDVALFTRSLNLDLEQMNIFLSEYGRIDIANSDIEVLDELYAVFLLRDYLWCTLQHLIGRVEVDFQEFAQSAANKLLSRSLK